MWQWLQALSAALEEFPIVNSSLNDKADALLQHSSHNIGVAMATPSGLVVPNIKNVQQRNVASIAAELVRLHKDAAIGRVNQSDISGGTISMSNIGNNQSAFSCCFSYGVSVCSCLACGVDSFLLESAWF